jgi:hypothetical protein
MNRLDALRRLLRRYRQRAVSAERRGDKRAKKLAWARLQVVSGLIGDIHRRSRR